MRLLGKTIQEGTEEMKQWLALPLVRLQAFFFTNTLICLILINLQSPACWRWRRSGSGLSRCRCVRRQRPSAMHFGHPGNVKKMKCQLPLGISSIRCSVRNGQVCTFHKCVCGRCTFWHNIYDPVFKRGKCAYGIRIQLRWSGLKYVEHG